MTRAPFHIGTSGFHYEHWRGAFYPSHLPKADFLEYYGHAFDTVEINHTFYRLPKEKALLAWKRTVRDDFLFAVKASRYITHIKKLKDPDKSLPAFLSVIQVLGEQLGPVLFQLPPRFHFNADRLKTFLKHLPKGFRYAFELRDPSWLTATAYRVLEEHGAAFCIYEIGGRRSPREITADFVYIRLHGPGEAYRGSYDVQTLADWAGAISSWMASGIEVYCYFDNDEAGYAVQDALSLRGMLS